MTVTAAVLTAGDAPFEVVDVELDDPGPGEALVRMVACGMCHTDLSMREARRNTPFPVVLGHEGAGVVEAVGPGVDLAAGQPVVLSYRSCGACPSCLSGARTYCSSMMPLNFGLAREDGSTAIRRDGRPVGSHFFGQSSFATHAVVDARSIVPVGDDEPLDLIGPLGCGVQTGAGAVLNVMRPAVGSSFAVLGSGAVGLSALLAAVLSGCREVVAVDVHRNRLELAVELGATHAVEVAADERPVDVTTALLEVTGGRGVDHVFDTTGLGEMVSAAVGGLAGRGTLVAVASQGDSAVAEVPLGTLLPGRTLRGVLEGDSVPQVFIPELLAHFRAGRLPFDRLVTHFPFEGINDAERASIDGSVVKPVLMMP